jgi:hypothetical protein
MLRQQRDAVALRERGILDSGFVIDESFLRRQPSHAHVNAGLPRISFWIRGADVAESGHGGIEQNNVNVVMLLGMLRANLFERSSLHPLPERTSAVAGTSSSNGRCQAADVHST